MGTRFIASKDSEFHENYKQIVAPAKAPDTTVVTGFIAPIRLWKNTYTSHHDTVKNKNEKLVKESEMLIQDLLDDQKKYEMVYEGHIENGAVPLGQSCGIISSIDTVKDIIENIVKDAEIYLKNSNNFIK